MDYQYFEIPRILAEKLWGEKFVADLFQYPDFREKAVLQGMNVEVKAGTHPMPQPYVEETVQKRSPFSYILD